MAKDKRSSLNPFTGKSHFDMVNDDKFLEDSYRQYYSMVQQAQVLDNTPDGQVVRAVAVRLIKAVEAYLRWTIFRIITIGMFIYWLTKQ